jgi:Cys-rich protein (TIGR01571 family)
MSATFSTGLLDCMVDSSLCLDVCICYPCQIGRQCRAVDESQVDSMSFCCCLAGMYIPVISSCMIRRKVVARFAIDEGCIMSTIQGCICWSCSLCQTHRELTVHKLWPGGVCCHSQPGDWTSTGAIR